jgi:hypothetical protein
VDGAMTVRGLPLALSQDTWIAVAFGVIGVAVAIFEGRRHIKHLKQLRTELDKSLSELRGEVETHYLGRFPEFIGDIVTLLNSATESITIFCDLPAYGLVSAPEGSQGYLEEIEAQAAKPTLVRMLHLNANGRRASLEIQFLDWEKSLKNPNVAGFQGQTWGANAAGHESFIQLVEQEQGRVLNEFDSAGVKALDTHQLMPLYFWIVDGEKAVFALTEFDADAHEVGFQTSSTRMIKALEGIFIRYERSRHEQEPAAVVPEKLASLGLAGEPLQ